MNKKQNKKRMEMLYELLNQIVKNTNITINLRSKPATQNNNQNNNNEETTTQNEPQNETLSTCLVKADLVQLVNDLEKVSATLKKINVSLVGNERNEIAFMFENFDRILNSAKLILNAV